MTQLEGRGGVTVKRREGDGGLYLFAWLPEACFAGSRLLDFAFAEALLEGDEHGQL